MKSSFQKPLYIVYALAALLCASAFSVFSGAQTQKKQLSTDNYHRPAPTKPIKPTIPDVNRYQEDKVFLEYADSLFRPPHEYEEFQIVKGSVKFRQGGMWMFCDSAYYYPEKNSMDAFGHVEMRQGDTLFVYADKLYYDGLAKHAVLTKGPSRGNVQLKNRSVTLTTDSLDYDINSDLGWYAVGGRLEDDVNTLTSQYGEYSPGTKLAKFRTDVVLNNRKDGYKLFTNELDYSTLTHIAEINSPTRIEGANDTIITTQGFYNTQTDRAELTSRSTILHSDSNRNVTTLEGDSIIYDKQTRTSRAFMFRNPARHAAPMVITDTARKVMLIGGYGEYNDSSRFAYSTDYPLLIEFSRPDSLYLRADTILSFIETGKVPVFDTVPKITVTTVDSIAGESAPAIDSITNYEVVVVDSVAKDFHVAKAIGKARFFNRDMQGIADTLLLREHDSILYMLRKPVVWSGERQIYGNRIDVHFNDSTPDWALLPESGLAAEHVAEDFYNQLQGSRMKAWFENKTLKRLEVEGNVIALTLPQEKDSSYNKLVHAESSYLTLQMDSNKVERMKMWPEVTGYVAPLFDVKKSQQFIEGFRWLEKLRPIRAWYGDRLHWNDELGDVSDELEQYFLQPPLFKVIPKPKRTLPAESDKSDKSDQSDQSGKSDQSDGSDQSDDNDQSDKIVSQEGSATEQKVVETSNE